MSSCSFNTAITPPMSPLTSMHTDSEKKGLPNKTISPAIQALSSSLNFTKDLEPGSLVNKTIVNETSHNLQKTIEQNKENLESLSNKPNGKAIVETLEAEALVKLETPMLTCFQFKDMNVLEHGQSVHEWYCDLNNYIFHGKPLKLKWRFPKWFEDAQSNTIIKENLLDFDILKTYQIYHDCGKPLCRTVDENGNQHFPNHAAISKEWWLECSNGSPTALQIAELIGMDMDIHMLKFKGVDEFANRKEAISLLLTGLCEIHSNACMFGGIDSIGFKIKWKQLDKIGKHIINRISLLTKRCSERKE